MEWQPIETAPTHKSIILCCHWKERPDCPFVAEGFRDWDGVWRFQDEEAVEADYMPPTHWMPLPSPPK